MLICKIKSIALRPLVSKKLLLLSASEFAVSKTKKPAKRCYKNHIDITS